MPDSTLPSARGAVDAASADERPRRGLLFSLIVGVAVAGALLAAYYGTIQKLVEHWSSNDMYSYGFLVPAISGYLIWLRRSHLATLAVRPSFGAGAVVLCAGLAMLVVGRVSATNLVEELSLPITIFGMSLLVLGRRFTQSLTFPLAYLVTMIPFWDVFTGRLHLPFQLYSAAMGVSALRVLNIPVFHQGVLIELPSVTLEVAEVCSGVNNLVALLCIGVPLTHFYVKGWPKRGAIIVSAALIALISNGARVATVCLFASYGIRGPDGDIHGPFSLMRSLVISGVGFFTLFWLISRFADSASRHAVPDISELDRRPTSLTTRMVAVALAIAVTVGAGTFERWHPVEPVPLGAGLVGFPTTIGRWEAQHQRALENSLGSLDFDAELARGYVAPDGTEVSLFLGYLESQKQGRELVGSGLFDRLGVLGQSGARALGQEGVQDAVISDGTQNIYLMFSFVLDGDLIAEDYRVKWRTIRNSFLERRSNGGIVVVAARLRANEDIDVVRDQFRDFVEDALPIAAALLAAGR